MSAASQASSAKSQAASASGNAHKASPARAAANGRQKKYASSATERDPLAPATAQIHAVMTASRARTAHQKAITPAV